MLRKWNNKFELRPGRWVFEPSEECRVVGNNVKSAVRKAWLAPDYYFHLRAGGHVEALRVHQSQSYFARFDIENFFGQINRSRITRCLKDFFSYRDARLMATDSTVRHPTEPGKWILPYGFVQSPILASLALSKSHLGSKLDKIHRNGDFRVSVYVDDIIISSNSLDMLESLKPRLIDAAIKSGLRFCLDKLQGPSRKIESFNIELDHGGLAITSSRMSKFIAAYELTENQHERSGIFHYVRKVNKSQSVIFS